MVADNNDETIRKDNKAGKTMKYQQTVIKLA